jgi:hypothetical protein
MESLYFVTQLLLLLFIFIIVKEVWQKKKVLNKKTIQMFSLFLLFPIWATLTALWSLHSLPSLLKGINFIFVVTGLFSALLLWVKYINGNFFKLFLPANLLIVLTSIFSLVTGIPNDAWNIGHGLSFAGFFPHQNVMGMALMFTLPGVFGLINDKEISFKNIINSNLIADGKSSRKNNEQMQKFFLIILLILNLFLIVITYTRSVILSLFIGLIFFLIIIKAYKSIGAITGLFILVVLSYITITPVNQTIYKILSKHGWDILATRTILWEPSYRAAKLGSFIGIGYGMSAPGIYVYEDEDLTKRLENYYREKGNCALAITEETGLIGLGIVFCLFFLWFRKKIKDRRYLSDLILLSFTFCFIVQSNFEGWVGGGSPILQLFIPIIIYPMLRITLNSKSSQL